MSATATGSGAEEVSMGTTLARRPPPARVVATARVPRRSTTVVTPERRGPLAGWFVTPVQTRPMRVALVEGGYLGIALVIGGLVVLLGRYWFGLTDTATAALLAAVAALFVATGLAVAGGPRNLATRATAGTSVRRGLTGTLFALAAGCLGGAAGVLASGHAWFAASAVGSIAALTGYAALPTAAGLLTITAFAVSMALSIVEEMAELTPLSVGAALVLVGALLAAGCVTGLIRDRDLGLTLGALIGLVGAQQPLAHGDTVAWAYSLTLAVGVGCLVLYVDSPATLLLPMGVLGISAAALEAMWDLTRGSVGVAATLIVTGATLTIASGVALRLWQNRGEVRIRRR